MPPAGNPPAIPAERRATWRQRTRPDPDAGHDPDPGAHRDAGARADRHTGSRTDGHPDSSSADPDAGPNGAAGADCHPDPDTGPNGAAGADCHPDPDTAAAHS
ncbi:MAG: hypothetical protein QF573_05935 [Chloroflexota bacterium]|nr:hypothetical protein [Chloroflexota bacterium]